MQSLHSNFEKKFTQTSRRHVKTMQILTHEVKHTCVSNLYHHWFTQWLTVVHLKSKHNSIHSMKYTLRCLLPYGKHFVPAFMLSWHQLTLSPPVTVAGKSANGVIAPGQLGISCKPLVRVTKQPTPPPPSLRSSTIMIIESLVTYEISR